MRHATLRARLFASYGVVALAGAATVLILTRILVPRLFDDRMQGIGRTTGVGGGQMAASQHNAVVSALNTSLIIGLSISLVVAAVAAVVMARRVLRPIDDLRAATSRLATGRYDQPVAAPSEPELAALANDVNRLATALTQTEQRRAALIGDIAHEMRTPLTTITGYVDGFGDGLFDKDEMIAAVSAETARLRRLAADLAAVSRVEEGQLTLDPTNTDLSVIVRTVGDRLRPQFDAKPVTLIIDATSSVDVVVDLERLAQALTNLIGNALAYTPPSGTVRVSVEADAQIACVEVSDSGRGIAPEDLEHVFERFFRADPNGHAAGTGIGLTIARSIARAHGGDLTAASEGTDRGATFSLTLPRRRPVSLSPPRSSQ
ncbi:MAG TPA: sensor histidine kinase [Acidimicrobiaceae bacterium]|nr:sensor histidine kinase [Acidimicrobiaceae bacterium]